MTSSLFDNDSPLTCDECRDLLDVATVAVLAGQSLEQELPGAAAHLAVCAECRAVYDVHIGVMRIVRREESAK